MVELIFDKTGRVTISGKAERVEFDEKKETGKKMFQSILSKHHMRLSTSWKNKIAVTFCAHKEHMLVLMTQPSDQ